MNKKYAVNKRAKKRCLICNQETETAHRHDLTVKDEDGNIIEYKNALIEPVYVEFITTE